MLEHEAPVVIAGMISVAIVVSVVLLILGRLKIEQQRTLQKLLEQGEAAKSEWARELGASSRSETDFRRGILFVVTGLALSVFMFFVGGTAWTFGLLPLAIGVVYLVFWKLNAARG
jgi:hypothetical protein